MLLGEDEKNLIELMKRIKKSFLFLRENFLEESIGLAGNPKKTTNLNNIVGTTYMLDIMREIRRLQCAGHMRTERKKS